MFDDAQATAKTLGVKFQAIEVKAPNPDFEGAFRYMVKERIGGLVTEGPPLISSNRERILQLAEQHRLPAIHTEQEWANDGGLMSYGANRVEPYRRVAVYVDKILKGAKAANLPVEQPPEVRVHYQPQNSESAQPDDTAVGAVPSGQGDQVRRGECQVSSDQRMEIEETT